MAFINAKNIENKLRAYSKTSAGRAKMKKSNERASLKTLSNLAQELIDMIKTTASSFDLAPSVMAHFNSLTYVIQDLGDGQYECDIYFTDDLSRESLEDDIYPGDGIQNIVALFNNGYVASSPKYGWWNGHRRTSVDVLTTGSDIRIRGTQARPSLHFMQKAIKEFESKYSQKYGLIVILNEEEYDGNYAGSLNGFIKHK